MAERSFAGIGGKHDLVSLANFVWRGICLLDGQRKKKVLIWFRGRQLEKVRVLKERVGVNF